MGAFYDDPDFSYTQYWQGREYEDQSEVLAIRKLLTGQHFLRAVDIGGGFGRLTKIVKEFCDDVLLLEPSAKMRSLAKKDFKTQAGTMEKTKLEDQSQDLVTSFRVLHHVPDLAPAFAEVHRILKPGGVFLFEFANSTNFKARLQSLISGQPILLTPIERRSQNNIRNASISFVNHHPETVIKILKLNSLEPINILSVSNLRLPILKRIMTPKSLVTLETKLQQVLSKFYFGPSIFVLARKIDKDRIL